MAQLASESEELHQVPRQGGAGCPAARGPCRQSPPSGCCGQPWLRVACGGTLGASPRPTLPAPPQVVSSILRNLSWRADIHSKKVLREVGSMAALMQCVLRASKVGMAGEAGLGERERPWLWQEGPPGLFGTSHGAGRPWQQVGSSPSQGTRPDNPPLGRWPRPGPLTL